METPEKETKKPKKKKATKKKAAKKAAPKKAPKTPAPKAPKKTKVPKEPKAPKGPKPPKAPKSKAPKPPKEIKDAENVLESIPTRKEIDTLNMEELETLFQRILASEKGLAREKEGFLARFYEHCEGLRHITAAKRHLRGEPPQEDNAFWAAHPSRTWRTTGIPEQNNH